MAIIGGVASTILWTAIRSFSQGSMVEQLHVDASIAAEQIIRHIRNIPKKADDPAPDISSVSPQAMTWNTNYTLSLDGSRLLLSEDGGAARVLLADVEAFSLSAYDENNGPLGASLSGSGCDAVRRVRIQLTVHREGISETVVTKVFIRSLISGS